MSIWGKPLLTGVGAGGSGAVTGNPVDISGAGNFSRLAVTDLPIVQLGSGTQSPTNIRALVPYTSLSYLWLASNAYDADDNPVVRGSISSTTGADGTSTTRLRTSGFIPVVGGADYYVATNLAKVYLHFYDSSQGYLSGQSIGWVNPPLTVTIPASAAYVRLVLANASDSTITVGALQWMWLGRIISSYTWQAEAGVRVYRGDVDPAAGRVLSYYRYLELDGTEDWQLVAAGSGGAPYVRLQLPPLTWGGDTWVTTVCSHLPRMYIATSNTSIGCRVQLSGDGYTYLCLRKTTADTAESIKAWLAQQALEGTPVQILYALPEADLAPAPIVRHTIASLGDNHVATLDGPSITAAIGGGGLIYIS